MKNKAIKYGAVALVFGGCICYYLSKPKKQSYDISKFSQMTVDQQKLQQACDKLGLSNEQKLFNEEFIGRLHLEIFTICKDQLIIITNIIRPQRRKYVEYDVAQYVELLTNELNTKTQLVENVMRQILEYGKQDFNKFQEFYVKAKQSFGVQKQSFDFYLLILRMKSQETKLLNKEEIIKVLDQAIEYLEQHSPQLYRFLKFIEEANIDKVIGMIYLMIFSDDNVYFATGTDFITLEDSLMSQADSGLFNMPIIQDKEVLDRYKALAKAKEYWS